MLKIASFNTLTILRKTSVGLYLGDEFGNDVLLPTKYVPKKYKIGETMRVFLYKDNEHRWVATTRSPYVCLNEFAYLKVRSVTQKGAFLEWGVEKDLFVPYKEQNQRLEEGKRYIVYVYEDDQTNRLVASTKINKFLSNEDVRLRVNEQVDLLVFETTPLGFNVIINNRHKGLVYHSDLQKNISVGQKTTGYIKQLREHKGIDVSLEPMGLQRLDEGAQKIMSYLDTHKGFLKLNDKSSPEEIKSYFAMSKKTFKSSLGILYKMKKVRLENDGVYKL